ncbi:MAG: trigger factor family protein [Verrucomicrobiota bacterium]
MNIVVEKQPKCVASLRVEIPADKVTSERQKILRTYINKSRLPGFRPGKAPQAVVEKRYGKDISEELQGNLINEAYEEALKQESLKVLDFGAPQNITTTRTARFHSKPPSRWPRKSNCLPTKASA